MAKPQPPPAMATISCAPPAASPWKKTFLIYGGTLLVAIWGILQVIHQGQHLQSAAVVSAQGVASVAASDHSILAALLENAQSPVSRLFLQLAVIVIATRAVGALFAWKGLSIVVGEMFAGILLGPSLLGHFAPNVSAYLFEPSSLGTLKLLSQTGVCLFMFVVGMEWDATHLKNRAYTAVAVSHASIVLPFFLGVLASLGLYSTYAPEGTPFLPFSLFVGIAVSITAFPVLARILEERGITHTVLGVTAITCAAVDDVTAWSLLALIVVITRAGTWVSSIVSFGLVLVFVWVMVALIKPRLTAWLARHLGGSEGPSRGLLAAVLVFIFLASLTTEILGIHALFGAFLAGVIMPQNAAFRKAMTVRLEHFSSVFLLPLFFAFTGLRTQVGAFQDPTGWLTCLGIIAIATLGKLGGSMGAAMATGMNKLDAFRLGALMNTRGLVELIALNIGYDLGILTPGIFTILVIMAMVTTLMTNPLMNLADYWERRQLRLAGVAAGGGAGAHVDLSSSANNE